MKKIRIISIVVLLLSTVMFVAFRVYEKTGQDRVPPEITFPEGELLLHVEDGEEKLLADVKAEDNLSGDVSGTLVVEQISEITEENERTITYAAIDEKGNVGRAERTLKYIDYQGPWFKLKDSLRYKAGDTLNVLDRVEAESLLDGDLSGQIKYTMKNASDEKTVGIRYVDLRVTDSAGRTAELRLPLEVYNASAEKIQVKLKEYLIYIGANTGFDPAQYFDSADQEGTLQIESNVVVSTPGVYYVDYVVYGEKDMGINRLIVIVN